MIQFMRGSTKVEGGTTSAGTWENVVLQDGQPGYDKTSNRLKIGDGHSKWQNLKWLKSGLEKNQIIDSEAQARKRLEKNNEDTTIFTYGKADPTEDLVGDVYFHQYGNGEVEADYVIEQGAWLDGGYRKWYSGVAECWGTLEYETSVETKFSTESSLFSSSYISAQPNYPFSFLEIPCETVSLSGPDNALCWLASLQRNTKNKIGKYAILAADSAITKNNFYIKLEIRGRWR